MYLVDFGPEAGRSMAAWLGAKTALTSKQIAAWAGLELRSGLQQAAPISPVNQGLIMWPEIRRCEASSVTRLERPIEFCPEPALSTEPIPRSLRGSRFHSARLGVLNFLTNGRNAWHSTWVKQYWPGALVGREAPLRQRAERQRTQGSVFYIDGLPALVLQSDALTLIGVEVNRSDQMARFTAVFDGPLTAGRITDAYAFVRSNTVIWLHARGNWRYPRWDGGYRLKSSSAGGAYYLNWSRQAAMVQPSEGLRDALRRARRSIRRQLGE